MVNEEAGRAQIERIAASRTLRGSDTLRRLLTYLGESSLGGRADELKEYTVGVDALGRPESYDPRQESTVRTQVGRLRQKIAEYYRTEGASDPVLIDLPRGGFKINFELRPERASGSEQRDGFEGAGGNENPPGSASIRNAPARWSHREVILATCLVLALALTTYFASRSKPVVSQGPLDDVAANLGPDLAQIWQPMFSSSRPLVVCLSAPTTVVIPGFGFARDGAVDNLDGIAKSPGLAALKGAVRAPQLWPSWDYTDMGTASAAFLMGQFLVAHDRAALLTRANLLSLPEMAEENVVLLGSFSGSRIGQALRTNEEIVIEKGGIRNLRPNPGEPAFLPDTPSGITAVPRDQSEAYAIISRLPGLKAGNLVLSLSGKNVAGVMAAAQAVTDPVQARRLVRAVSPSGQMPEYFQAVLKVQSMDNVPMRMDYVFSHIVALTSKPSN